MLKHTYDRAWIVLSVLATACLSFSAAAENRIIDGRDAAQGQYPWMAAIVQTGLTASRSQFCGGALIAPNWVITAEHCIRSAKPSQIEVVINRADLRSQRIGERIGVKRIVSHPEIFEINAHDIALLELTTSSRVTPISLIEPEARLDRPGTIATVMGWGLTRRFLPYVLKHVDLPIMSHRYCATKYPRLDDDLEFCAGYVRGGRNSCFGDSGGPLLTRDPATGEAVLVGLVSYGGFVCAAPDSPGVYARVKTQRDWIDRQINGTATPAETSDVNSNFAKIDFACSGLTCAVDGRRSDNNASPIVSYAWDMGDGTTLNGPVVRHTFLRKGIELVALTTTRADGTADKAFQRIEHDTSKTNDVRRLTKRYTGDFRFSDATDEPIIIPRKRAETGMWVHDGPLTAEFASHVATTKLTMALERFNESSLSWEEIATVESGIGGQVMEVDVNSGFHRLVVNRISGFGSWSTTMTANRATRQ